ncbi:MAG: lytic transglycosylase domain-containing protein [Nocardioidaceae bacterium]|nr:lytic transglycosylase domain-containing protein [Nocardioidaceae bacterium]MCL2614318.1 lytic transglycosylase domain-containing protein [Nocardioidaceae bacterium]
MADHERPVRRHPPAAFAIGLLVLTVVVIAAAAWDLGGSPGTGTSLTYVPTARTAPGVTSTPVPAAHAGSGVPAVSPAWVATTARRSGIPATAVLAYARAELGAPCQVGWTTLAGIGWVESQHGTIGGRTLRADGVPSRPVVGPALEHGLDHAYGPMQFIPDTWSRYASDGDGDGRADVDDIFDAAAATAKYLCADGDDLSTASGWARAIFSYNHSQQYVDDVYAAATAYDRRTR